jgi:hypothetical protein
MARLPKPGGDAGQWANILNEYLLVAHNPDGTAKVAAASAFTTAAVTGGATSLGDLNVLNPTNQPLKNLLLSNDGTNLIWKQSVEVNVTNYGAKGDGVTDDTAAIQAAINDTSDGGSVFFPRGVFMVHTLKIINKGTSLIGDGRWATQIIRIDSSANPVIDMSGTGTGLGHTRYNSITDLTISGNGLSGTLMRSYYADNCLFNGISFINCPSASVDFVEVWDSRFTNCSWEDCGSDTEPATLFRNSTAQGTFGYSEDNTNQIHFVSCRWETFRNGAVRLDGGANGSPHLLNGVFMVACKMETSLVSGPALQIMKGTTIVFANQLYIAILKRGVVGSSPIDAIVDYGSQVDLSDVYIQWGSDPGLASSSIRAFLGGPHGYKNISAYYPTDPPAIATVVAEPGTIVSATVTWANRGPLISGNASTPVDNNSDTGILIPIKNSGAFRVSSSVTGKDLVRADNSTNRPSLQTANGVDLAGFSGDYVGEKWRFHGDTGFVSLASGNFQVEGTKGYLGIGTSPYTGIGFLIKLVNDTDRGLTIIRKSASSTGRMLEFQDETNDVQGIAFDTYGRPLSVGQVANISPGDQVAYANVRYQARDTGGSVSAAMKPSPVAGSIATITFFKPYPNVPLSIIITDQSNIASDLYVSARSATGFTVSTRRALTGGSTVNFDYSVLGSE